MSKIDYAHLPLTEQLQLGLSALGNRRVRPTRRAASTPTPRASTGRPASRPTTRRASCNSQASRCFHIQDIDFRSNSPTFQGCLRELKQWSQTHPDHPPVFITMNAKDEPMKRPDFTVPTPFTAAVFNKLDQEILDNLGREYIIMPDEIRG